ncbi:hypothetical protein M408DRAFT_327608 [Serendipita vermifera MAFF 305830]|uniref:BTB domain-containing protein n=1 Tax=Serendipita vermifera MAFF 305830 TaxID=933852 RepID=A0A0C2WZ73_SERVB|nr:hypothetical protein M408DRAFT_327608 [Serendipita vermifera MAFF 305830]
MTDADISQALASKISKLQPSTIRERVSPVYPAGHGDIALITLDNTLFHVHRAILQHSSLVFATIFENGPKEEPDNDQDQTPLKMETDGTTLEQLLTFAYPDRQSPTIDDVDAIASIFRAAKRYEMEGVLQQLRKSLVETRIKHDSIVPPLYVRAPLAVLVICYAFDCPDEGRLALRECLKGNLEDHIAGSHSFELPSELLSKLLHLRAERMAWFTAKLNALPWPVNGCAHCLRKYGEWRLESTMKIQARLNIEELSACVSKSGNCASGHPILNPDPRTVLTEWLVEAKELEEVLPKLPRIS